MYNNLFMSIIFSNFASTLVDKKGGYILKPLLFWKIILNKLLTN